MGTMIGMNNSGHFSPVVFTNQEQLTNASVVRIKNPTERSRYRELIAELSKLLYRAADMSDLDDDKRRVANDGFVSYLYNASGRSLNTLRQTKHSLRLYLDWCEENQLRSLPTSPYELGHYLNFLEMVKGHAPSTISAHLSVVSLLHRIAGMIDVTKTQHVIDSMASIRMNAIRNGYTENQQAGFRKHHLQALRHQWENSNHPRDRRDLALLSLAWDSLLRESELARVTLGMLKLNRNNGHYIGRIGYTKTSNKKNDASGSVFFVSRQSYQLLMAAIIATGGDPDDRNSYVFYPLTKKGFANKRFCDPVTGFSPLSGEAVDWVFDRAYQALKPEDCEKPWRGHSARIGRAQDLSEAGATNKQIMQLGRWEDPKMPSRYTREQDLSEIAAQFI